MKVCKICGKAMDDNYTVCPYCGAALSGDDASEAKTQPHYDYSQQQQQQYSYQSNANQQQYNAGYYQQPQQPRNENTDYTPAPRPQRSAYIAAILAFTLGVFGVHNFYLDKKNRALTQLLVALIGGVFSVGIATIAIMIWGYVEGVKILKGEINTDGTGALIKMSF